MTQIDDNNFDFPKVTPNKDWKITLFSHQLTAIWKMEDREKNLERSIEAYDNVDESTINTNIGIYSDPTGYGKTLSIVGLLARDKMEWDIATKYVHTNVGTISDSGTDASLTITHSTYINKVDCSLLLVNQSIISQWENELKLLNVKYYIVNSKKKAESINIKEHKLILIIPTMYNKLMDRHQDVVWKRFLYDEPVNTHLPAMRNIRAGFYWFITATPSQLNRQGGNRTNHFLRGLFNYWMADYTLNALIFKNDIDYVKSSYRFPETNHLYHVCYQPVYNMCREYIDSETSDMISAGNISGAIQRLGGNETSNIFELIKIKLVNKLKNRNQQLKISISQNNTNNIRHYNTKRLALLKQLENIKEQYTQRLSENCSICLDNLEKPVLVPCCQNIMCGACILEWTKNNNSCPLCRTHIDHTSLVYIKSKHESPSIERTKEKERELTKPETILKIINNNKKGKFIVFSNYSETFQHIHTVLGINDIKYNELRGQTSTRVKIIDSFKKGDISVLFLNSKNNGAGINLQEATDIILYHEMSDDLKTQVIGRANRIGRKSSLFVHHLL
jgi:hypothetical protein